MTALSNGWKQWCKGCRSLSPWLQFLAVSKLSEPTHPRLSTALAGWICESKPVPHLRGKSLWDLTLVTLSHFTHKTKQVLYSVCLWEWTHVWMDIRRSLESRLESRMMPTCCLYSPPLDSSTKKDWKNECSVCWHGHQATATALLISCSWFNALWKTTQLLTISIPITWQLTYKSQIYKLSKDNNKISLLME